jgi:hypothetical protein
MQNRSRTMGSKKKRAPHSARVFNSSAHTREARASLTVRKAKGAQPGPLLTLRAAVILMASLLAATASALLTFFATGSLPEAFLAAGPAGAAVITLLNAIIAQR